MEEARRVADELRLLGSLASRLIACEIERAAAAASIVRAPEDPVDALLLLRAVDQAAGEDGEEDLDGGRRSQPRGGGSATGPLRKRASAHDECVGVLDVRSVLELDHRSDRSAVDEVMGEGERVEQMLRASMEGFGVPGVTVAEHARRDDYLAGEPDGDVYRRLEGPGDDGVPVDDRVADSSTLPPTGISSRSVRCAGYLDEPKLRGLDRTVQNLVILTYAAQTNRSFALHGGHGDRVAAEGRLPRRFKGAPDDDVGRLR